MDTPVLLLGNIGLSASAADMGISMRNGIRRAVEEINAMAGGVLGRQIDDAGKEDAQRSFVVPRKSR